MTETVISIENVVLNFPRRRSLVSMVVGLFKNTKRNYTALNGISLEIFKGEIIGIIGIIEITRKSKEARKS